MRSCRLYLRVSKSWRALSWAVSESPPCCRRSPACPPCSYERSRRTTARVSLPRQRGEGQACPRGGVPIHVEKEKWRILPVGDVDDQPAALAGGHRRNAP